MNNQRTEFQADFFDGPDPAEAILKRVLSKPGSLSKREFALIGISWPPQKGWRTKLLRRHLG